MTAEGPWEIPPLDDAEDIARAPETQPGVVLADTSNWAGFILLIVGGIVAIAAAVVGAAGYLGTAFICAIIAILAALSGAALVLFEHRLRRRSRPSQPERPAWQSIVPPGA